MPEKLHKKALLLSYFTVVYNIIEGILSIFVGASTGSISLVGFGLDSFIESLSGSILIWRFTKSSHISNSHTDETEQKAIRLISYTFFILGGYVLYESITKLLRQESPTQSVFGIIIAVVSIMVMIGLYKNKINFGMKNHIRSIVADSRQTLACIWMSITMLFGLGLHYMFGIWWSDAVAGIVISMFLFKEGYNTYREKKLCSC
ncbi:cation transporter [Patescibacteria group bacterium]|nr:cation transporter [Patescibacteria group bacterium]MCL5797335.1 cation transporter [Patescibacteria group bacterium]